MSGAGADLFRIAGENDLEGIVSKPIDKPYHSGRRPEWLKTKCVQSDTFVIIGYQTGGGAVRTPFANIKVATLDGARLRYAGEVGTGFSEAVAVALRARLDRIATPRCPIAGLKVSGAVWVSPDLRAEIAYCGTTTGELRHESFCSAAIWMRAAEAHGRVGLLQRHCRGAKPAGLVQYRLPALRAQRDDDPGPDAATVCRMRDLRQHAAYGSRSLKPLDDCL